MGLLCMTPFVEKNGIMKSFRLQNTNLVVDGSCVLGWLYEDTNSGPDVIFHPEDYDDFVKNLRWLFNSFAQCKIESHVIFNGGHTELTMAKKLDKLSVQLNEAANPSPDVDNAQTFRPMFMKAVAMDILDELGVRYVTCCTEDSHHDTITAFANHLNCPVLSKDSNFYLGAAPYISYKKLSLGKSDTFFECLIFNRSDLMQMFKLNQNLLPIIFAVLQNDRLPNPRGFRGTYDNFFRSQNITTHCFSRIKQLFLWLSNKTYDSATSIILKNLGSPERKYFLDMLEASKRIIFGVDTETYSFKFLVDPQNNTVTQNDTDWFYKGVTDGRIAKTYIDLYLRKMFVFHLQAEDFNEYDSFLPSIRILRYAFDLLTGFSGDQFEYIGRQGATIHRRWITDADSIAGPEVRRRIPFASGWNDLPDYFGHFLLETLPGFPSESLEEFPADCSLLMLALVWCRKYGSRDTAANRDAHCLLLSYVRCVLETSERAARVGISKEDCLKAITALGQIRPPAEYEERLVHGLAQFQNVLEQLNCLSRLCVSAHEPTRYHKVYSYKFVYAALAKVRFSSPARADVCLEKCLYGAGTVLNFYRKLNAVYSRCVDAVLGY